MRPNAEGANTGGGLRDQVARAVAVDGRIARNHAAFHGSAALPRRSFSEKLAEKGRSDAVCEGCADGRLARAGDRIDHPFVEKQEPMGLIRRAAEGRKRPNGANARLRASCPRQLGRHLGRMGQFPGDARPGAVTVRRAVHRPLESRR